MGSEDFGSERKEINVKRFVSGRGASQGGGLEEEGTEEGSCSAGRMKTWNGDGCLKELGREWISLTVAPEKEDLIGFPWGGHSEVWGRGFLICKGRSLAFGYQNEMRNCAWKRSVLSKE